MASGLGGTFAGLAGIPAVTAVAAALVGQAYLWTWGPYGAFQEMPTCQTDRPCVLVAGLSNDVSYGFGANGQIFGMDMSDSNSEELVSALRGGLNGQRADIFRYPREVTIAGAGAILAMAAFYVAASAAWNLQSAPGRAPEELRTSGTRPLIWRDALSAVTREPLWGFGWTQVGAAQQAVALERPSYFEHVEHAHNLLLDFLVWAGIPVGGTLALLCLLALASQVRRVSDPRAVWLMTGALGLFAHALLELPLEYAYFLIPFGVSLGMVNALSARPPAALSLPRWALPTAGAALGTVLTVVALDYLPAEESLRMARLETSRIGTDRINSQTPELRVLDQLEAFLRFVRTEPHAGMTAAELDEMRKVSQRFGFAPSLYRYAIALGLNGQPGEAARTLQRLCHIHAPKRCAEAREGWTTMQQRYEALRAVPPP